MDSSYTIDTRVIRDAGGIVWQVTESHAEHVPGSLALTCLVFDSQSICRRYWRYPADWLTLADAPLLELMEQPRQAAR